MIGTAYAVWARQLTDAKHPGLALYAIERAHAESVSPDPALRESALKAVANNLKLSVLMSPTGSNDELNGTAQTIRQSVKKVVTSSTGEWMRLIETVPADSSQAGKMIVLQTSLNPIVPNDDKQVENKTIQYQSGWNTEDNPDYAQAEADYQRAQDQYQQAQAQDAQNQQQAQSLASSGNLSVLGAAAVGLASGVSKFATEEMRQSVETARDHLANTPRTIRKPEYADEPYQEITHNLSFNLGLSYAAAPADVDNPAPTTLAAVYSDQTVEVVGDARHNVPVRNPTFPTTGRVISELTNRLLVQIDQNGQSVINALGSAAAQEIDQGLAGKSSDLAADERCGAFYLWRQANTDIYPASQVESDARSALGISLNF
jgi:hypothetical protein